MVKLQTRRLKMRINVIPTQLLSNVHLRAEFREIIMSIHYFKRSTKSKRGIDVTKISETYTLNEGHAMFFFNKFGFILKRFFQLRNEMTIRNFKTESIDEKFMTLFEEHIPLDAINDYSPTKEDILINLQRILRRIYINPSMYSERQFIEWCYYYAENLNTGHEWMNNEIVKIEAEDREGLLRKHLQYKEDL